MKILKLRETPAAFFVRVHLDDSKLTDGGQPDPAWVRQRMIRRPDAFPIPAQGEAPAQTKAQWLNNLRDRLRAEFAGELADMLQQDAARRIADGETIGQAVAGAEGADL